MELLGQRGADARLLVLEVSFGCDLGDVAPSGLTVERWDDVPAVSADFNIARDVIVTRLTRLLAECEGLPNSTAI